MITHIGNGWVFHGGWEYPLYLMLISVVVALQAKVRARVNVPGANAINAA